LAGARSEEVAKGVVLDLDRAAPYLFAGVGEGDESNDAVVLAALRKLGDDLAW
jgi:hypothetical protein